MPTPLDASVTYYWALAAMCATSHSLACSVIVLVRHTFGSGLAAAELHPESGCLSSLFSSGSVCLQKHHLISCGA